MKVSPITHAIKSKTRNAILLERRKVSKPYYQTTRNWLAPFHFQISLPRHLHCRHLRPKQKTAIARVSCENLRIRMNWFPCFFSNNSELAGSIASPLLKLRKRNADCIELILILLLLLLIINKRKRKSTNNFLSFQTGGECEMKEEERIRWKATTVVVVADAVKAIGDILRESYCNCKCNWIN